MFLHNAVHLRLCCVCVDTTSFLLLIRIGTDSDLILWFLRHVPRTLHEGLSKIEKYLHYPLINVTGLKVRALASVDSVVKTRVDVTGGGREVIHFEPVDRENGPSDDPRRRLRRRGHSARGGRRLEPWTTSRDQEQRGTEGKDPNLGQIRSPPRLPLRTTKGGKDRPWDDFLLLVKEENKIDPFFLYM